ncbi:deoxyribodipyrimidine photolyase [Paramagnetospirillum kuznetsovii]|uniref:Deoxyribodipyrimidine photo-lyase n=1 Tax=Paramagnetospirillum kuznetsovii TaxID=2053833 RepID=A0A364NTQ3_9PROT|nr:deoxyribodipyrimidine photo-lyase [Paramagnetospirillum kuznetsovii]RAU20432.1 deoxyribodipyrimidine photolyase [Paramagnetospirillum kuznetsovii]
MISARPPVLLWFRRDLRLGDNAALSAAAASGRPIIAVHVLDPEAQAPWRDGAASRWWLHHSLSRLDQSLDRLGLSLLLRRGPTVEVLTQVIKESGADQVAWTRGIDPAAQRQDDAVAAALAKRGVTALSRPGDLLFEPDAVLSKAGTPFRVFTPFWKACLKAPAPTLPLPPPAKPLPAGPRLTGDTLADWRLQPSRPDWAAAWPEHWQPGEAGAARRLTDFLNGALPRYAAGRDHPAQELTSRLSPHLHFGEISPRQVFHAAMTAAPSAGRDRFLAELGWRAFSAHLLHQFPDLPRRPLRPEFERMAWRCDPAGLRAWQRGQTGYPLVDAGMRQLWATGWMHNRVRMVAASFLVKDLLISWREGQDWFWDTLVDADLASNAASWQWVAGCGADAAPFFRIFNPVLQGEKFDPDGAYVRRWCPELAALPDRWLHRPWQAPSDILRRCGIDLGKSYPLPVVDHDLARHRALAAFTQLRD